jgi:thiol-disulfide isomerase/thioredoxin
VKANLFLIIGVLLLVLTGCKSETPAPREGEPAPDFELTALSGEKVRLSGLRGKVVLLNFWASWCPPCREEIPSLITLNAKLPARDFQLLTVAIDKEGREAIAAFFGKTGASLPTLLDSDGLVGKDYGITGVPETFVIDKQGIIRKKVIGPIDWSDPAVIRHLDSLREVE